MLVLLAGACGSATTPAVESLTEAQLQGGASCTSYNVQRRSANSWLIVNPRVINVFWGSYWSTPDGQAKRAIYDDYWQRTANDPVFWSTISEYGIGVGSFGGSLVVATPLVESATQVTLDTKRIDQEVARQVDAGLLPKTDDNDLFVVHLPPSAKSNTGNAAYHGWQPDSKGRHDWYALIEYYDGDWFNFTLSEATSHEIMEAATDPDGRNGFRDSSQGEIGDICGHNSITFNGHFVQRVWSQLYCQCIAITPVWTTADLGGVELLSDPNVVGSNSHRRAFYQGPNQHLWLSSYDNGPYWGAPVDLGGVALTSAPSAVVYGAGYRVFYRGPNGHLWYSSQDGGTWWSAPVDLGGAVIDGAPSALALDSKRLRVFYRGPNGHLWYSPSDDGSSWGAAVDLGGTQLSSAPAAVVPTGEPTHIKVFYRGPDQTLWMSAYDGSAWGSAIDLGGEPLAAAPAVVASQISPLDVFGVDLLGDLLSAHWKPWMSNWLTFPSREGVTVSGVPSPRTPTEIYYRGTNGHLWVTYPTSGDVPTIPKNLLTVTNGGGGTVTSDDGTIGCSPTCTGAYEPHTRLVLTATANSGFVFAGWSGACTGSGACAISMDNTRAVEARFSPTVAKQVRLDVTLQPDPNCQGVAKGTVTSSPGAIECTMNRNGTTCSALFDPGSVVSLAATAGDISTFESFSGACSGGSCSLTMDSDKRVTATFCGLTP